MSRIFIVINILLFLFLSSCATAPVEREDAEPLPDKKEVLSPAEREKKAFEKFNEILIVRRSSRDRKAVLPKMEQLYVQLIDEYPDVPVAQESYWKLVEIYTKDYSPPLYDKAEELYDEFVEKYPESGLKRVVDKTLALSFYINKEWERLLRLCDPEFKKYIEEGISPYPLLIFMYAEANFHLRNFEEAEKGFKIVMEDFPQLNENRRAKDRIKHMNRVKH
jgi:tetratricopeptide (TPR) repeat protein